MKNHPFQIAAVLILLFVGNCTSPIPEAGPAEIDLDMRVIHPRFREEAAPSGGVRAETNPPVMLCPLHSDKSPAYSFRLSTDSLFSGEPVILSENLPYAIFNPHTRLSAGTWHWQYRYDDGDWSKSHAFVIDNEVPEFVTPKPEALIQAIPQKRPRVLIFDPSIDIFRMRAADKADAAVILERAGRYLTKTPPKESLGVADLSKGATRVQKNKLALDASKKLGSLGSSGTEALVKAYLISGEDKYALAAIRWANEIASWDPNGVSMTNNFADSELMLVMSYVYDACQPLLSDREKDAILHSVTVRGNRFYDDWISMLEAKVFSGHVWQHILERLFKTSLAVLGDVPDAAKWLKYVYEIWLARAPVLGPPDGGWWNGNHYMELNALTLLDIPMILQHFTGINYFRSHFYRNNPFWLIYSFPADSYSDGFGNGTEKQFGQKLGMIGYTDALSRITGNPYAAWYADHHLRSMGKTLADDDEFRWFRLKWELPDRPAPIGSLDLPKARAFPLTGTGYMHTDLTNAVQNLMVSMRSSPYGSTSHAHSDQNSFNIQYGGEKLFYNSGYRPSMGVPHYVEWFKASIGHNTVLIDGEGQPTASAESYGWLPRFLHGSRISYSLGDASNAYDNTKEIPQQAGMKRFRRHLVLLRPSTIVVYDELAADHDADWSWLIHSHEEISADSERNQLWCTTKTAASQVNLYSSGDLHIELSTKFDPEPVNFRDLKDSEGNIIEYQDQWHVYGKTSGQTARYLAIIQVAPVDSNGTLEDLPSVVSGKIQVGGWIIQAELNASKPATFAITHARDVAGLAYNHGRLTLGDKTYEPATPGSTLLVEEVDGEIRVKEAVDEVPEAWH